MNYIFSRPSSGSSNSRAASALPISRNTSSTTSTPTTAVTPSATTQPLTPRAPRKGSNPSSGTTATPISGAASDTSRVLLSELQNYLAGINPGGVAGSGTNTAAVSRRSVDLSTSLNSDSLNSIISDPDRVNTLQSHLPIIEGEEENVKQQLKETLASPQFQQALSMFSSALQSGQLGPVVSQFQLSPEAVAAANIGDLEQFIKALEKTAGDKNDSTTGLKSNNDNEKKSDKDDDEMTLG